MSAWTLKFDSACLFDFLPWRRTMAAAGPRAAIVRPPASREVSERRAEAMRGFFPKVSAWMAKRSYLAEMREVDRYLGQSADLFDLERRIRDVERRGAAARWF